MMLMKKKKYTHCVWHLKKILSRLLCVQYNCTNHIKFIYIAVGAVFFSSIIKHVLYDLKTCCCWCRPHSAPRGCLKCWLRFINILSECSSSKTPYSCKLDKQIAIVLCGGVSLDSQSKQTLHEAQNPPGWNFLTRAGRKRFSRHFKRLPPCHLSAASTTSFYLFNSSRLTAEPPALTRLGALHPRNSEFRSRWSFISICQTNFCCEWEKWKRWGFCICVRSV